MRALTREEAVLWCRERGIVFSRKSELGYGSPNTRRLDARLPGTIAGLIYAARVLVRIDAYGSYSSSQSTEHSFGGCLIWVAEHRRWSSFSQDVGTHVYSRLGTQSKSPVDIEAKPARLFDKDEILAATATLVQPLIFQWDAHVISHSGNFIATVTHEGMLQGIIAREPHMLSIIKPMLNEMGVREGILTPLGDTIGKRRR